MSNEESYCENINLSIIKGQIEETSCPDSSWGLQPQ